jgi:hypothetical protein
MECYANQNGYLAVRWEALLDGLGWPISNASHIDWVAVQVAEKDLNPLGRELVHVTARVSQPS